MSWRGVAAGRCRSNPSEVHLDRHSAGQQNAGLAITEGHEENAENLGVSSDPRYGKRGRGRGGAVAFASGSKVPAGDCCLRPGVHAFRRIVTAQTIGNRKALQATKTATFRACPVVFLRRQQATAPATTADGAA